MAKGEIVDSIYREFEGEFKSGLHNLLWQVVVNGAANRLEDAFYPVHDGAGQMLALASKDGGYRPTTCYFNDDVTSKRAHEIAEVIALKAMNQSTEENGLIVMQSFKYSAREA